MTGEQAAEQHISEQQHQRETGRQTREYTEHFDRVLIGRALDRRWWTGYGSPACWPLGRRNGACAFSPSHHIPPRPKATAIQQHGTITSCTNHEQLAHCHWCVQTQSPHIFPALRPRSPSRQPPTRSHTLSYTDNRTGQTHQIPIEVRGLTQGHLAPEARVTNSASNAPQLRSTSAEQLDPSDRVQEVHQGAGRGREHRVGDGRWHSRVRSW